MGFLKHFRTPAPRVVEPSPPHDPDAHVSSASPDDAIAGVSLETYVSISRELADVGYDAGQAPALAARQGVDAEDWDVAVAGWNQRMHDDPTIARRFNTLYTQH